MLRVVYDDAALEELCDAADSYEQISVGLGSRLIATAESGLTQCSRFPLSCPEYYRDLRKLLLRPFPFLLLYRATQEAIQVVAVVDARRDPMAIRRQLDLRRRRQEPRA
jgi:toxin ParE1/3/4